jgi:AraC family L-rhamnose operon transcriptional activator RhaR
VEKLRTLIEADPATCGTRTYLDEFAKSNRLSISRLRHLFRQQTGLSPGQYTKRLKMQIAGRLLADAPLRIKEVLAQLGLRDRTRFSRDFKSAYGASPSAYRAQMAEAWRSHSAGAESAKLAA